MLERLEQLRAADCATGLTMRRCADEKRFAANFEELLQTAWRQYLAQP